MRQTNTPRNKQRSPQASHRHGDELVSVNISIRRRHLVYLMVGGGIAALLVIMALTNPTIEDFQGQYRSASEALHENDPAVVKWLAPRVNALRNELMTEREDYVFFSLFVYENLDGSKTHLPGAFGRVWGLSIEKRSR